MREYPRPPNKKDRWRSEDGVVHVAYRNGNTYFIRCTGLAVHVRSTTFIPATCLLCIKKDHDREIAKQARNDRWISLARDKP